MKMTASDDMKSPRSFVPIGGCEVMKKGTGAHLGASQVGGSLTTWPRDIVNA